MARLAHMKGLCPYPGLNAYNIGGNKSQASLAEVFSDFLPFPLYFSKPHHHYHHINGGLMKEDLFHLEKIKLASLAAYCKC